MQTQTASPARTEIVEKIAALLEQLPPGAVMTLQEIFELLARQQSAAAAESTARLHPYRYSTVAVRADETLRLAAETPIGYSGDALADTEALYLRD
jgi:hypothetical protein